MSSQPALQGLSRHSWHVNCARKEAPGNRSAIDSMAIKNSKNKLCQGVGKGYTLAKVLQEVFTTAPYTGKAKLTWLSSSKFLEHILTTSLHPDMVLTSDSMEHVVLMVVTNTGKANEHKRAKYCPISWVECHMDTSQAMITPNCATQANDAQRFVQVRGSVLVTSVVNTWKLSLASVFLKHQSSKS